MLITPTTITISIYLLQTTAADDSSLVPKNLSERKKKSAQERCQAEEEIDEIRKSHQEELDKLRQLLKKARVSTDQAAAEQVMGSWSTLETKGGHEGLRKASSFFLILSDDILIVDALTLDKSYYK